MGSLLALQMHRVASMGLKPPPSGPEAFTWSAFGKPPTREAAPASGAGKHKPHERGEGEGAGGGGSSAAASGAAGQQRQQRGALR